jgi:alpha-glucoside transport system substrate-binding protein
MSIFERASRQQLDQAVEEFVVNHTISRRKFLQVAMATGLSASAASALLDACGSSSAANNPSPPEVTSIDALTQWSGEELDSFNAIISAFMQKTNISVNVESTRDMNAVLTTRIKGNNPPDICEMPGISKFQELAAGGQLIQLDKFLDMNAIRKNYDQHWIDLASYNGKLYGVLPKANSKGTIWYNPSQFKSVGGTIPQTWNDLLAISNKIAASGKYPWAMGVESSASSGWPATDWVAEIYLNKYGPELYDQWVTHKIPWTHPTIKDSIQMFGQIVTGKHFINSAPQSILATNFQDASYQPFISPPQAYMYYLGDFTAGFISSQFKNLQPGKDFAFFPFPGITPQYQGSVTGGADIMAALKDNNGSRQFMAFLASAEAQEIWVKRGGSTSINKSVDLKSYPNDVARASARQLIEAKYFKVGAGDLMPAALQVAYWKGMLTYIGDPTQLDNVLNSLESNAQQAYQS